MTDNDNAIPHPLDFSVANVGPTAPANARLPVENGFVIFLFLFFFLATETIVNQSTGEKFFWESFYGVRILVSENDRYVNATNIASDSDKRIHDMLRGQR
jgi:hypothetical protein